MLQQTTGLNIMDTEITYLPISWYDSDESKSIRCITVAIEITGDAVGNLVDINQTKTKE